MSNENKKFKFNIPGLHLTKPEHPSIKTTLQSDSNPIKNFDQLMDEYFKEKFKSEEEEFESLVRVLEPKGFTRSNQVSEYITKNNLSRIYRRLSGILKMEKNGNRYHYINGISPKYYRLLCQRLSLSDQQSGATVIDFISHEDLEKKKEQ